MAVPVAGQSSTGADDSHLETVMVYARRLTPVSRVAATVTVIDQARSETTLATDIRELVRYEPGLSVRNDPFRFGLDTISVRGLGGNRVAVEVDGIPAAGGFAVGSYADSGRAYVDAAFVERVEFLRGPASSLYGSDAIGGVVAMTTFTPEMLLTRSGGDPAVRTDAGYDSASDGWRAAALAAGAIGGTQWLVGYSRREGHESDTAADVTPNPSEYTKDSALMKFTSAAPGGPMTFTAESGRIQQATDVDAYLGVGRFLNTTALAGDDENAPLSGQSGAGTDRGECGVRRRRLERLLAGHRDRAGYLRGAQGRAATHATCAARSDVQIRREHVWHRVHGSQEPGVRVARAPRRVRLRGDTLRTRRAAERPANRPDYRCDYADDPGRDVPAA
ncbi:MAG: TonB-dependent receptor plug domain-containing protein [Proteobacteria bacterium]|nr:TonB-dependent receptor plug domain-containing protein [Pseudomonadota bacterium]